ncbi:MAG: hypothetical protein J5879_08715 [Clostridia bacterium]|nr:hypothetical protein [Clostridia bacterium]
METNRSKAQYMYQKSDASIRRVKIILLISTIILIIASVIAGIVLWTQSEVGLGFLFALGIPLAAIVSYNLSMAYLWSMFDIKVIRTVVTKEKMTDELLEFVNSSDDESDDEYDISYVDFGRKKTDK